MSDRARISDEELHALIDGEIGVARRAEIEEIVAQNATIAERISGFRADKARLKEVYGRPLDRRVPEKWLTLIEKGTRRSRSVISLPAWAAIAATVIALIIGAIAYRQNVAPKNDDIIAEALAVRANAVAPRLVETIGAGTVAADRALAVALKMHVRTPDLAKLGYRLAGLQLYSGVPGGQAAELIYRSRDNRLFTLYLRHSTTAPRFDQFEENGIRVCIWQDDVVGTVMAGKISAAEMQRLASLAYTGLTL